MPVIEPVIREILRKPAASIHIYGPETIFSDDLNDYRTNLDPANQGRKTTVSGSLLSKLQCLVNVVQDYCQ